MLKAIHNLFNTELHNGEEACQQSQLDLAAAALLAEVIVADNDVCDTELQQLKAVLKSEFSIAEQRAEELVTLALEEVKDANDVYQFTRLINDNYEYSDKCKLIKSLWKLAYADAVLDKYEEYTIRKVAELIYVSHGDFIKAKVAVKQERAQD